MCHVYNFIIEVVTTNFIVFGLTELWTKSMLFFSVICHGEGDEYMWLLINYLPFCNCLQLLDHIFLRKCFVQTVLSETQKNEVIIRIHVYIIG